MELGTGVPPQRRQASSALDPLEFVSFDDGDVRISAHFNDPNDSIFQGQPCLTEPLAPSPPGLRASGVV